MAHVLHAVTFDDGTESHTLEPPDWVDMSQAWAPVSISSIFEAYSGAATKQINSGATQKQRLTITVTGCQPPSLEDLDQSLVWTVTTIDPDDVDSSAAHTMWCEGPPEQTIDNKTAKRSWTINLREQ